jgi:hypothetical protein
VTARLEAVPEGLLARAYEIRENSSAVGRVEHTPLPLLKRGTVTLGDQVFPITREGVLRPNYLMNVSDGSVRARAEKQGLGGYAYRVRFGDSEILLKKKVFAMRERFILMDASGELGEISRDSILSRRMTVILGDRAAAFPREVVLFLIWIALMIHRAEAAASA